MKITWIDEERYDDEYKELTVNCRRGVDGVILPNNLTGRQYQEYVSARNGKVIRYNIKVEKSK